MANVVAMLDDKGGFKALDSAALPDNVEAATIRACAVLSKRSNQIASHLAANGNSNGS